MVHTIAPPFMPYGLLASVWLLGLREQKGCQFSSSKSDTRHCWSRQQYCLQKSLSESVQSHTAMQCYRRVRCECRPTVEIFGHCLDITTLFKSTHRGGLLWRGTDGTRPSTDDASGHESRSHRIRGYRATALAACFCLIRFIKPPALMIYRISEGYGLIWKVRPERRFLMVPCSKDTSIPSPAWKSSTASGTSSTGSPMLMALR
jgi:hypothetical protein